MNSLEAVAEIARTQGLRYVLVGGNAMILHGSDRATLDVDIAVPEGNAAQWQDRLVAAGFSVFHATGAFVRFRPPATNQFPVDLVIVDASTFEKLWQNSRPATLAATTSRIPDPHHLIAMKLHALKHGGEPRRSKDFDDILTLMRICQISPDDANFRSIVERYGTPQIATQIRRAVEA